MGRWRRWDSGCVRGGVRDGGESTQAHCLRGGQEEKRVWTWWLQPLKVAGVAQGAHHAADKLHSLQGARAVGSGRAGTK